MDFSLFAMTNTPVSGKNCFGFAGWADMMSSLD
jgi:hypothetical protein